MRRPTRNLLYVVLGFVCVALLVQGVGLKLPGIMPALAAVSGATVSSPSSIESQAASLGAAVSAASVSERTCTGLSSIEASFNATPIAEGNFIWFNSAIHVDGLGSEVTTIFLNDSAITFAANGTNYSLAVPAAAITFDPAATSASTSFDAGSNRWATMVPGGFSGKAFLSGLAFRVPAGGLPGGISSITWSAAISTDKPGLTAQWGWGAAVYSSVATDYNALGIDPIDEGRLSHDAKMLSKAENPESGAGPMDSVGKPANLEAFVIGGAGGEGGSDFTGSVMAGVMSAVTPCAADASSSSRTSITLTNRSDAGAERVVGTDRILLTRGMGSTKNCSPSPASPGASIQCIFTMQNLDPQNPVTGLEVTGRTPDPLASASAECDTPPPVITQHIPCFLLDPITGLPTATQVTTLQPAGTIDPGNGTHTYTCGGIINETAPGCQTSNCNFTDRVTGSGVDMGVAVNASTGGVVVVSACTPTPTNTPNSTPTPVSCSTTSSIQSNFNGTPISAGNYVWFNSILKVSGLGSGPTSIFVTGGTIQFSANGTNYNLTVPDATVTFSPTATTATTSFSGGQWMTVIPFAVSQKDAFLSGLTFSVPVNLPGGINPVTWTANFTTDTPGVTFQWKWAAAVYTCFSMDYNALGVKPTDDNKASIYKNSDHAGTPENFTQCVIGGARGGGGSNFTGSYSGTARVAPCVLSAAPTRGTRPMLVKER